jgi:UDP-N-acetylglucosamine 2-epimerase
MPEENNRMLTDAITDLFFVTEEDGRPEPAARGQARKQHPPGGQHHD